MLFYVFFCHIEPLQNTLVVAMCQTLRVLVSRKWIIFMLWNSHKMATVCFFFNIVIQRGSWLPREVSIHFLLATPQSSIPRDMSLDLAFNSHRVLLRIRHPLKTIILQGWVQKKSKTDKGFLRYLVY